MSSEPIQSQSEPFAQILVMRHPQTQANVEGRYVGQTNSPLTELGKLQCARAQEALIAWSPDKIVSSPMERCLAITQPVAERLGLFVTQDHRALEFNFGRLEGKTYDEVVAAGYRFPWECDGEECEDCESMGQVAERVDSLLRSLVDDKSYRRCALVTHGGIVRFILRSALSLGSTEASTFDVDNVSSCLLELRYSRVFIKAVGLAPEELKLRCSQEG